MISRPAEAVDDVAKRLLLIREVGAVQHELVVVVRVRDVTELGDDAQFLQADVDANARVFTVPVEVGLLKYYAQDAWQHDVHVLAEGFFQDRAPVCCR